MLKRFSLAISALFFMAFATSAQTKTLAATPIKTSDNSPASAIGVKINKVDIMVDTSIRVKPSNAYMSMDFSTVTGTTMTEVLSGNNLFWVYDEKMKEVKIADKLLKKVGGSMESAVVNFTVKIPFRLKTDKKKYTVKYRWESPDKRKWIEVTTTK